MQTGNYFDPGTGDHVVVDGQIVERDALHIAERIKEYDEDLEIMCVDPDLSDINDAPFVICWRRPNGTLVKVFEAWQLDNTILERVALADQYRYDAFDRVTTLEEAAKKLKEDRYRDMQLENQEVVAAAVKNLKSSFSFKNKEGDKVTIHDDKPPTRGSNTSILI